MHQAVQIGGPKVCGRNAGGVLRQVGCQDLIADIAVVQLRVAQGNVVVQRGSACICQQQLLVDLRGSLYRGLSTLSRSSCSSNHFRWTS